MGDGTELPHHTPDAEDSGGGGGDGGGEGGDGRPIMSTLHTPSTSPPLVLPRPVECPFCRPSPPSRWDVSEGAKALALLTSGLSFIRHCEAEGGTVRLPLTLHYRQRRERGECSASEELLYWSDASPSVDAAATLLHPSRSLSIARITDIYLGKQTPLLLSPSASSAKDDCCIALISQHLLLELEGTAPSHASALLAALQFICTDGGRAVSEDTEAPPAPTLPPSSPHRTMDCGAEQSMQRRAEETAGGGEGPASSRPVSWRCWREREGKAVASPLAPH